MRVATWNVNSIRARLDALARVLETLRPDVLCLQETKVEDGLFPAAAVAALGYPHQLVNGIKGYNGVAILSRVPLAEQPRRLWCGRDDGRHLAARLPDGVELHNFYVPAGGDVPDPARNDKFAHKLDFIAEMTAWFADAPPGGRILVGDLNIAPLETDVWSHRQLLGVVCHTPVEVAGLDGLMAGHGWIDAVRRIIPPERHLYTWWSYRNRSWPGSDRGRRLDHIWITSAIASRLRGAQVLREARGWPNASDHVPVTIDLGP